MPIKHNEINANVKAQAFRLGVSKGLKLYPRVSCQKAVGVAGPGGGRVCLLQCKHLRHDLQD